MWTPHPVYLHLGNTDEERAAVYRGLVGVQVGPRALAEVRAAMNKGLALGNDRFKAEIERLTGRRVVPGISGPKAGALKAKREL